MLVTSSGGEFQSIRHQRLIDDKNMRIHLNGEPLELDQNTSVQALIEQQGLSGRRLAVEVNQTLVPRGQFAEHRLAADDRVEIIQAVGGG
jgi:sulfur carrier protein